MPRTISFEGRSYTFPDDATDEEIADALSSAAPAPTRAQPPQGSRYEERQGFGATYLHGATIGTGDEILGAGNAAVEAVRSFADPSRSPANGQPLEQAGILDTIRPRDGLTPQTQEQARRVGRADPTSGATRFIESARQTGRVPAPLPNAPAAAPTQPTLQDRLGAAQRGAVRGFDDMQDQVLQDREQFYEDRPIVAATTEIAGGIASPASLAPVGQLGRSLPVVGGTGAREAMRAGALYGAGYTVATGEDWEERLDPERLAVGTGVGIGGGYIGNQVGRAIGGIGSRFGLDAEQRAVRMIDRGLRDAGTTPADLARMGRSLRARGGPTMETVAEVSAREGARTQPLVRMARAVANVRGPGQQIAEEALEGRGTGVTRRVLGEATRATGQRGRAPRNFYDARETLRQARAGEGSVAYRAAHSVVPDDAAVQSYLLPFMREAPREAAASGARQLGSSADRVRAQMAIVRSQGGQSANVNRAIADLQAELDDILLARRQLQGFADGAPPNTLNTRAVDYFQRGIRQMERAAGEGSPEAGALRESRNAFNQMADTIVPEFGAARVRYGESIRVEEMMDAGRRVFNMPEGEIDILLRGGLSAEEFDGFMLGALDAIETKVRAGDTRFVLRFMNNENWQRQLERALGRNGARRLRNRIAREAGMRGFDNTVRRPSQTTPMAEDIRAMTQGEDELGFLGEIVQSGGNVRGPLVRLAASAYDRVNKPGIYNERVNEALARRLYGRATPANIAQLEAEIAALPGYNRNVPFEEELGGIGARLAEPTRQRAIGEY